MSRSSSRPRSRPSPAISRRLLRNVQDWIREESLYAIRFMLDNEIYVLAAGATEWKTPSFLIPVEEIEELDEVEESSRAA